MTPFRTSLFDALPIQRAPERDFPEKISVDEMEILLKELKLMGWNVDERDDNCAIWWPHQSMKDRTWIYRKDGDVYKLKPLPKVEYR